MAALWRVTGWYKRQHLGEAFSSMRSSSSALAPPFNRLIYPQIPTRWKENGEEPDITLKLYRLHRQPQITQVIRSQRLRWLGHIWRSSEDYPIKMLKFKNSGLIKDRQLDG
ncbi:hypothetical protein TNCV_4314431 [Trichonephila clavipes]|nr:hypothetical protein TNCV_4314431 [Trichonephila clavipes]